MGEGAHRHRHTDTHIHARTSMRTRTHTRTYTKTRTAQTWTGEGERVMLKEPTGTIMVGLCCSWCSSALCCASANSSSSRCNVGGRLSERAVYTGLRFGGEGVPSSCTPVLQWVAACCSVSNHGVEGVHPDVHTQTYTWTCACVFVCVCGGVCVCVCTYRAHGGLTFFPLHVRSLTPFRLHMCSLTLSAARPQNHTPTAHTKARTHIYTFHRQTHKYPHELPPKWTAYGKVCDVVTDELAQKLVAETASCRIPLPPLPRTCFVTRAANSAAYTATGCW